MTGPGANPSQSTTAPSAAPAGDNRTRLIEAMMTLAATSRLEDITMTDIALKAGLTLAGFRDCFPSKGAVLAGFAKMIDRKVLEGTTDDLLGEPARDRLFDVLMRRLDAMTPYREGLREVNRWVARDPASALALNSVALNSMRFMLEAANIDSEGTAGAMKLQGLVLAWRRIVAHWLDDESEGQEKTMAALDRELERGGRLVGWVEDLDRIAAPFRSFAGALFAGGRRFEERVRGRMSGLGRHRREADDDDDLYDSGEVVDTDDSEHRERRRRRGEPGAASH
ncbi:MAG: TetR/AcrR family transcriptional regulator [Hyphomicrobiales bacterium]|nr:TetR/AcrR family transcriptional regulator [Hyphomicrobiales bacterium]